ncbi:MAG: FecR domain-containing protein [Cyclobacteriaceae bacterium]
MERKLDYTCYKNYKAQDLAMEDSFIEWVNNPDGSGTSFWKEWCHRNPEKSEEIQIAKQIVINLARGSVSASKEEIDEAWRELEVVVDKTTPNKANSRRTKDIYKLCATVLLAVMIGVWIYASFQHQQSINSQFIEKYTDRGQRLTTILPDGSKVILNADSKISYPEDFGVSQRKVNLTGEAYFDIRHDKDRPFIVNVGNISTKVLGTTFNIKAYSSDQVQIALESGMIQVKDFNTGIDLKLEPGELILIDSARVHPVQKFDHKEVFGWQNAYLCFTKTSFKEAIESLERWYGVDFEIREDLELDSWKFHGKFHNKSLTYVLHTLSYPDLFKYEIKDKKVTIY